MADISKITLPSGTSYNIKDAGARSLISDLQLSVTGAMHYIGITTTELTDGSTTATVVIDGDNVGMNSNSAGAVCIYDEKEYVWNGSKWQEFGSTGSLKALAFKDSASGTYTPAGSVSQPTFSGNAGSVSVSGTPTGSVTISTGSSGTANYTPGGTVSQPTTTVTLNTTDVYSITAVGTLPTCTLPTWTGTVENENLTIAWTNGSFSQGTLPTKGSKQVVATSVNSATTTQPTFSGNGARLVATFNGESLNSTGTFTPEGTVSKPTFSGTQATITVS